MFDYLNEVLTQLENASGTKAKEVVLRSLLTGVGSHEENICAGYATWMLKAALDQGVSYGIDKIPGKIQVDVDPGVDQADIDEQLVEAVATLGASRGVTDETLNNLVVLMSTSDARYRVMSRILKKDLRCGVQAKTVNKVVPGLVFRVPYQRCSGYDRISKMTFPAYLQRKANGMFAYLSPAGDFISRQGNRFIIPNSGIAARHAASELADHYLMGELVILDEDDAIMGRAKGNGIINSFMSGSDEYASIGDRVRMYVWGMVSQQEFILEQASGECDSRRFAGLCNEFGITNPDAPTPVECLIRTIEHWSVFTFEEAQAIFKQIIAKGEEGCVLKSMSRDFLWKDQSSCDFQIKMKAEAEAEFIITGIYAGESGKKYEGKLGGISIKSGDGLIVSDCGGGFDDATRNRHLIKLESDWVGKIVTVKFNGITESKDKPGVYALDHPRFIEIRTDKAEADSLSYCQKLLKGELA